METVAWFAEHFGLSGEALVPLLVLLILVWGLIRVVNNSENPVEWWHFFSVRNPETGEERGDVNSLGMMAGVVVCLFIPLWLVYKLNDVNWLTLGVCLLYLGAVKTAAAFFRATLAKKLGVPAPAPAPASEHKVTRIVEDTVKTPAQPLEPG